MFRVCVCATITCLLDHLFLLRTEGGKEAESRSLVGFLQGLYIRVLQWIFICVSDMGP